MTYTKLKNLNWETAANWLARDARDDFFPDPIRFRDLSPDRCFSLYYSAHEHRLLQYDQESFERLIVPKANLLRRDTVFLPYPARLLYCALLRELFPPIADQLSPGVFSYVKYPNVDPESGEYPFPSTKTTAAWTTFENRFREALLEPKAGWGVKTDLANFYEHIRVDSLIDVIRNLATGDHISALDPFLERLEMLLKWCARDDLGVPQNYDPSSFFCSAYLTPVDREMAARTNVRYFRWVDDIRFVARTRGEALDALHVLQSACQKLGLYLNSAKTTLIEPQSPEFYAEMDVSHDVALREIEDALESQLEQRIRTALKKATQMLNEAEANNNDRMVRAYGGRILEAGQFEELREESLAAVRPLALRQFRERPGRSDWWSRLLSPHVTMDVQTDLCDFLGDRDHNRNDWTNMWALITLARAGDVHGQVIDTAQRFLIEGNCLPVRARALLLLGKFGDNLTRLGLAQDYLSGDTPACLKRACILAAQELPGESRDSVFKKAVRLHPDLSSLVEYLNERGTAVYDYYQYPSRRCSKEEVVKPIRPLDGVGLLHRKVVRFRTSRSWASFYE